MSNPHSCRPCVGVKSTFKNLEVRETPNPNSLKKTLNPGLKNPRNPKSLMAIVIFQWI